MNIAALFDEPEETEDGPEPSLIPKLRVTANDNDARENQSPYSKQIRLTPFLHADGIGAFPSDDLPKFVDYYLLPNGKCPKGGCVLHVTDDNGDDVWVAVIPECDPRVGEPWGTETYTTEAKARMALADGLKETVRWS